MKNTKKIIVAAVTGIIISLSASAVWAADLSIKFVLGLPIPVLTVSQSAPVVVHHRTPVVHHQAPVVHHRPAPAVIHKPTFGAHKPGPVVVRAPHGPAQKVIHHGNTARYQVRR